MSKLNKKDCYLSLRFNFYSFSQRDYLSTLDKEPKDKYKAVRRFLYTTKSTENREVLASRAYKAKEPWPYSIHLEDVVAYLMHQHNHDPFYARDRNIWMNS